MQKKYDNATIKMLFNQFQNSYFSFYCQRAKQNNISIDLDKRKNISILVIVGSSIKNAQSKHIEGTYQKNSEDLSTALLIRHLFHYAFGIPYKQILITSTQNSDFYVNNLENDLISEPKNIFNDDKDINPIAENIVFKFSKKNAIEFELNQMINVSQVRDQNYKFLITEDLSDIIKPFNINVIKNDLYSDCNTHLLVFFIDHEYVGGFGGNLSYQFFIERLLQIECKHFYVFNDSCYCGSLIKHIQICRDFRVIFPDINNPKLESALLFFLTNLSKVSPEHVKDSINDKIGKIDSFHNFKISKNIKNDLIYKLQNIDDAMVEKISHFVSKFDKEFSSVGCIPQHFIAFSEKATIFSSSSYDQISLTLPGRKLDISAFDEPKIRVFGSVFTSILIESFLDTNGQSSFKKFSESVCELFQVYKEKFIDKIISQNKFINVKTENNLIPNKEKIISFFDANQCDKDHLFSTDSNNDWPDFSSIILEEKYWNIDKSDVDQNEYENVFFCMFKIHNYEPLIENPNNYGPAKGSYCIVKFIKDFEHEVNLLLEKSNLDDKFEINDFNQHITSNNSKGYSQFISSIRTMINSNNWQAIHLLKSPISLFMDEHPNDVDALSNLFAEAFKNIIIFWREYELKI